MPCGSNSLTPIALLNRTNANYCDPKVGTFITRRHNNGKREELATDAFNVEAYLGPTVKQSCLQKYWRPALHVVRSGRCERDAAGDIARNNVLLRLHTCLLAHDCAE
ncbi:hypothetical protein MLAC_21690 [Mycobacterium lacus]|uniref:Uncharacterized protein n=1 Tax=Mycobacterium lacus TaxID=169765 RepID=A0A7I7NJS6_9MYCO|nr:hypothetical protein MLAC_21690 [Mycobacterium lacus]